MAARKLKKLPKDIENYIHDDDALKAIFERCEINAYDGLKNNILFYNLSEEMLKWCLEQGADINFQGHLHHTPLKEHACNYGGDDSEHQRMVNLLIKYGADINLKTSYDKETALFAAVRRGDMKIINALIDAGADLYATNWENRNALEDAFVGAAPGELLSLLPVTKLFLEKGVPVTETLKKAFIDDAKEIEFYRCPLTDPYAIDFQKRVDEAMDKFYTLFGIEHVPQRKVHDGVSEIHPTADTWMKQHEELWDFLVPGSGACSNIQGEVIRITGRLSHEVLDNGGGNWDSEFRKLVNALKTYYREGQPISDAELAEVDEIAKDLPNQGKTEMYRLEELAVKWVLQNPVPMAVGEITYKR